MWHISNHPQEELAKSGQIWLQVREKRKVYKFKNHSISQLHVGTYCLNMAAREYFPLKSGEFGLFSYLQKSFYESYWISFVSPSGKNAQN
jgi:hypothetical protein